MQKFIQVRKPQIILLTAAFTLLMLLFFFGKTINPNKPEPKPIAETAVPSLNFDEVLNNSKQRLTVLQKKILDSLEQKLAITSDKPAIYNQLAVFWKDSAQVYEPYLFYMAEAAKLVNSEKTLTFAAQLFVNSLLDVGEPAIQNWLATNAKVLFDKALTLNPNNDSSIIGRGACYILGNISSNPMEGILPVRAIAAKTPDNLYAQMILGLGGKKSGQYDKAIERFLIIAGKEPKNIAAALHLAECYELKQDKVNAKIWYLKSAALVDNAEIKKEIEKRAQELK